MSSQTIPSQYVHNIDDDDDEFDWEAAVREIDVACEDAALATTSLAVEQPFVPVHGDNAAPGVSWSKAKRSSGTRQSTLDKFIHAAGRRPGFTIDSLGRRVAVDVVQSGVIESGGSDTGGGRGCDDDAACYCDIDLEAAKTWIYPVNVPLRDYQLSITTTALFSNTLVALPTGLGKTLIAAVVMYNYFRWFPTGKIVFTAPSRPLVLQQIEACHNIVGIPQEWTIDMTGQISPPKRAQFWETKRVFFVTPQVFEKDIQSGTCLVKQLVCLVIDEAHRALGNYSYCVAVRELLAVPVQLRILALTATPGSKQQTIQNVINNLQISKLEYRNESDLDVSPYVHNRNLELIQVAMGKDAVEINDLLLEAIKPFVGRLCSFGLLPNRDFQTLSPCDLLNSRDKFRQAPPLELPQIKYGEVEGYFGALITLYHIRKLLSSHGIRPAFEMLEEKLQQGSFARIMSRNEVIWKAKLVMQQSLSHGVPSPKLSKMIEILTDHFKTNDPKSSRVIIFSNFRGSVRDIMESLSNIGDIVKATEFIGQSSGKALKGQSQKVQQAVLQKFRAGGYNVIVATSIGEEGLDIMEVDLVICFDANVSPLRMIQRMGRTGRKHDGRVVVLACEGSELKGYLRKQANSKAIRKHMRNGGMNSFDFHSSPRMIPHICKPEVQFVELSIEQFVPRGRKVKSDQMQRLAVKDKISDSEAELLANYFHSSGENTWKPSLVAFPHFQAFPSRVHKVAHSFRTGMLIDAIQQLQGLSFADDNEILQAQVEGRPSGLCLEAEPVGQDDQSEEDFINDSPKAHLKKKVSDLEQPPAVILNCEEKQHMANTFSHSFLFGPEFVSVGAFGMVSISFVPAIPLKKPSSHCETIEAKRIPFPIITSFEDHDECRAQPKVIEKTTGPDDTSCVDHDLVLFPSFCNSQPFEEKKLVGVERTVLQTPSPKGYLKNSADHIVNTPASLREKTPWLLAKGFINDLEDIEMSPRLTNMVEKGVVPESPIDLQEKNIPTTKTHSIDMPNYRVGSESGTPVDASFTKLCNGLPPEELSSDRDQEVMIYNSACSRGYNSSSPVNEKIQSPLVEITSSLNASCLSDSPVNDKIETPFVNLTNSCSKDWHLSSGEASKSIHQVPKLKRLRRYGESCKRMLSKVTKENRNKASPSLSRSFAGTRQPGRITEAKQKRGPQVELFFEKEAEVSQDIEVSDDEEEDKDCNSYDDSFIDDRANLETSSTQAEVSGCDMMAIYRRSLLSQSPMVNQLNCSNDYSPDTMLCTIKSDESGGSRNINHSIQKHQTGLHSPNHCGVRSFTSCQMSLGRISLVAMPGEISATAREEGITMESRKRKPSFHQVGCGLASSIQPKRLFQQEGFENSLLQSQDNNNQLNIDLLSDDQFYEGLDFDALEAEATERLRCNSVSPMERRQQSILNPFSDENIGTVNSPSFDLGI